MNNKKAQNGPVSFVFSMLFFFIFIALAGGTLWGLIGVSAQTVGLEGIEAFIFNNFAMITIISALMGTMAYFRYSGGA